ncbi:MAG TPA: hypothetical protein DIC53_03670 [Synergistaceae bacterium]|jgi:GntR family transcriptional repressor for pyruvate dehydrogenase complex|nr:hypothetical protein [Synergistaceae bacterium]
MIKAASRLTLYEDVLNQLSDAIEKGMWAVGDRIPGEKELAQQFNVSRSCIREAVKVLSDRGIVVARPGSGTYLLRSTADPLHPERTKAYIFDGINLKEIIETRCLIEGQIAYYAAKRGREDEFEELEAFLHHRPRAQDDMYDVHIRFHGLLAKIARQEILGRMVESIQSEISVQRERYKAFYDKMLSNFICDHSEIVQSVRSRDGERAREAMMAHISSVWSGMFDVPLDIREPSPRGGSGCPD